VTSRGKSRKKAQEHWKKRGGIKPGDDSFIGQYRRKKKETKKKIRRGGAKGGRKSNLEKQQHDQQGRYHQG